MFISLAWMGHTVQGIVLDLCPMCNYTSRIYDFSHFLAFCDLIMGPMGDPKTHQDSLGKQSLQRACCVVLSWSAASLRSFCNYFSL